MVTRKLKALNRRDLSFWWDAYLGILPEVIGSNGNLVDRSSDRLVELAEELAWKSLDAFRRAQKGQRS